jgi:hypothetical protein
MKLKLDKGTDPELRRMVNEILRIINVQLQVEGRRIVDEAKSNMDAGAPPTNPDDKELSKRSGSLYNSVRYKVGNGSLTVSAGRGRSFPYAKIHETGFPGVIVPKRAKWLTLPTERALGSNGLVSSKATGLKRSRALVAMFPRATPDKGYLVKTYGADQGVWFLLRKRVPYVGKYPSRPYLRTPVRRGAQRLQQRLALKFNTSGFIG